MKRLAIALLIDVVFIFGWGYILGYSAGYAAASASRPAQVIPAASASRSESDPGRTGAPNDPGADPARAWVVSSARDPIIGRGSPRHRSALRGAETAGSSGAPSPAAEQDSPPPSAVSVRGTANPRLMSTKLAGTWYCNADPTRGQLSRCSRGHPDGPGPDLFAAVSPDLAELRGQTIRVCLAARCVIVQVIDCTCEALRSVDLYADAFAVLAPLGVGRLDGLTVVVP